MANKGWVQHNFWKSDVPFLKELPPNCIFVFGSNPEGRHGFGAARDAVSYFGAINRQGSGLQGQAYALITKNLSAGYSKEYPIAGRKSVPLEKIKENVQELYDTADAMPDYDFIIVYHAQMRNLNGWSAEELFSCFMLDTIPDNIYFHYTFSELLEKYHPKANSFYHRTVKNFSTTLTKD